MFVFQDFLILTATRKNNLSAKYVLVLHNFCVLELVTNPSDAES